MGRKETVWKIAHLLFHASNWKVLHIPSIHISLVQARHSHASFQGSGEMQFFWMFIRGREWDIGDQQWYLPPT